MDIVKHAAVKLLITITTQELYDRVVNALKGSPPEVLDTISFAIITGYASNIKRLFGEGLLYLAFGTEAERFEAADLLEIHVRNHRDEIIIIKHHEIKDILNHVRT